MQNGRPDRGSRRPSFLTRDEGTLFRQALDRSNRGDEKRRGCRLQRTRDATSRGSLSSAKRTFCQHEPDPYVLGRQH